MPSNLYDSRFQSHYENSLRYDLAEKLCVTNSHQTPKLEKIILSASVSFKPQQVRGPGVELGGGQQSRSSKSNVPRSEAKLSNAAATNKKNVARKAASSNKARGGNKMPIWGGQNLEDCTVEVRKALILLSGQTLDAKVFRVGRPHLGIRKGRLAAYQVTLRNQSMYLFLERLITEVLPKIMKTDPALLITGGVDRRLQRTIMKVANFKISDYEHVPLNTIWLNDGSSSKEVIQSFFDGNGNFQIGIPDFYLFREIEQNIEFTKLNGLNVTIVTTAKTDREARLVLSGFQAPFAE